MESRYKVNSKISLLQHVKVVFLLSYVWISQSNAAELDRDVVASRYIDVLQLPTTKRQVNSNELQQELQAILFQIQNGLNEGDANKIMAAHIRFEALESEEVNWQQQAHGLNVYKWSSQTNWREAIGGYLFFSPQIFMWDMLDVEKYRLSRRDTVISLVFGVKYKHPICMYYLAQILEDLHTSSTDAPIPQLIPSLFGQAYSHLKCHENNPDACYVLGKLLTSSRSIYQERKSVPIWCDPQAAVRWHEKGLQDIKNHYAILRLKRIYKAVFDPVSSDEFLQLARGGFPLAYLDAACLQEGFDQKELILQEAILTGYGPALIDLGSIYEDRHRMNHRDYMEVSKDLVLARNFYKQAGQFGFFLGYVHYGRTFTGPITFDHSVMLHNNIRALPLGVKADIELLFQHAVTGHHPEGCDYLAELASILLKQEVNDEERKRLNSLFCGALEEGIKLGSVLAYSKVKECFSNQLQTLIEKYGPALQEKAFRDLIL